MASETKPRSFKVYLEGTTNDVPGNRTMHVAAESKEKAKRIAERNAEDVAAAEGGEPYEVVSVEPL